MKSRLAILGFTFVVFCLTVAAWITQGKIGIEEQAAVNFVFAHWGAIGEMIVLVGACVGLYYRMENRITHFDESFERFKKDAVGHWEAQERSMKQVTDDLENHKEADRPHTICATHQQSLVDIGGSLTLLHQDISDLRTDIGAYRNAVMLIASRIDPSGRGHHTLKE